MISADDSDAAARDYDWVFDEMGRLEETQFRNPDQIVPYNYKLKNKYDADSRRTDRVVNVTGDPPYNTPVDILTDQWWYDRQGRVIDQYQWDNGWNYRRATYGYFADGQLKSMDRYKFDNPSWTKLVTTNWTYDGAGQIDTLEHRNPSNVLFAGYDYGWDAAGRMTAMDFTVSTWNNEDATFAHDDTGQLTGATRTNSLIDEAYTYDENGNRISQTREGTTNTVLVGANNRLTVR
jgi:YD repeat-containing protein